MSSSHSLLGHDALLDALLEEELTNDGADLQAEVLQLTVGSLLSSLLLQVLSLQAALTKASNEIESLKAVVAGTAGVDFRDEEQVTAFRDSRSQIKSLKTQMKDQQETLMTGLVEGTLHHYAPD